MIQKSRRKDTQRGQAALMVTLSVIPTLGLLGLVVDIGWGFYRKEACRTAAQAAATAAATVVANADITTCNAHNVTCQNATPCPASPTLVASDNMSNGCLYAQQNGFVNSGQQTVTMEAHGPDGITSPISGSSPNYWVAATVCETKYTLFSAVGGRLSTKSCARSTSGVFSKPADACIYSLSPTGTGFSVNGTITINSGCGIYVDSNDPYAAMTGGGNSHVTASRINVVGTYSPNGGTIINPTPTTGAPFTSDPLASVPAPNYPTRCDSSGITQSSTITMPSDGFYVVCNGGFSMNSNGSLNLPAGTYVLKGGGIDWKNGTLTNTNGVTFYLTGGFSSISVNGNMNVTLNSPTSGSLRGVLFFQDRSQSISSVTFNGGSGMILNGALYFPTTDIKYSGGSTTTNTYTALIGYHVNFIGDSYFTNDLGGIHNGLGLPTTGVLE